MITPLPILAMDDISTYHTMNLEETLGAKGKKPLFSDYSENDYQVPIYLFWEYGCNHCDKLLDSLNENTNAYGKYFRLISFEISQDTNNKELLNEMIDFLNLDSHGVPFMIIGDYAYQGYQSSIEDDYLKNIITVYKQANRYDVISEMMEDQNKKIRAEKMDQLKSVMIVAIIMMVFITLIIYKRRQRIRSL